MHKNKLISYALFLFAILFVAFLVLLGDESDRTLHVNGSDTDKQIGTRVNNTITIYEYQLESGKLSESAQYSLDSGNYTIGVEYYSESSENYFQIVSYNEILFSSYLNPSRTYETFNFHLNRDYEVVQIVFYYAGSGTMVLNSYDLSAESGFYRDTVFAAVLVILIALAFGAAYIIRTRKQKPFSPVPLFLFAIGALISLPLMNNYLLWGNDIAYHLARIEGIKDGLREGQFPVMIYPEGLQGHGYLNAMYPNLFLYIPAILRLMGVSIATSYKFLLILSNIACVLLTYSALRSIKVRTRIALMATTLYVLLPYHFTNLYSRAALGEALAMAFLPIALTGLYHVILGDKTKNWQLILGITGLIQSHVLSSLIVIIICVLAAIIFIVPIIREKRLLNIAVAAVITLLINLWFIIPFLHYYSTDTLNTDALNWSKYQEYTVYFDTLFGVGTTTNFRSLSLGLPIGVMIVLSAAFVAKRIHKHEKYEPLKSYSTFLFFIGLFFLFMIIQPFPGDKLMVLTPLKAFMENLQFPWRLLGIVATIFTLTGAVTLNETDFLNPHEKELSVVLAILACLIVVPPSLENYPYIDYDKGIISTYSFGHANKVSGIPVLTNSAIYPYEWRTKGLTNALVNDLDVRLSSSNIAILEYNRLGTTTTLTYSNDSSNEAITLPITFYDGYYASDESGTAITLYMSDGGEVAFIPKADNQSHTVTLRYTGILRFKLGYIVSLISIIGLPAWFIIRKRRRRNASQLED